MFFLSAALIVLCGVLHGFQSEICLLMLSLTGMEGALLVREKERLNVLDKIFRLLYLLLFPVMLVMFVCYELKYPEYEQFLPYLVIASVVILIFAAASFFFYNPYRGAGRKARDARDHIEDIEKSARKEVRKNKKSIEKELKKQNRRLKKEEKRKNRAEREKLPMKESWQKFKRKILGNKEEKVQDAELMAEEVKELTEHASAEIPETVTENTETEKSAISEEKTS